MYKVCTASTGFAYHCGCANTGNYLDLFILTGWTELTADVASAYWETLASAMFIYCDCFFKEFCWYMKKLKKKKSLQKYTHIVIVCPAGPHCVVCAFAYINKTNILTEQCFLWVCISSQSELRQVVEESVCIRELPVVRCTVHADTLTQLHPAYHNTSYMLELLKKSKLK